MNELVPVNNSLIGLLHTGNVPAIPKPFEHEILLSSTHVAGTSYVEEIEALAANLTAGEVLTLKREPDNAHDTLAVLVLRAGADKLGYVPRPTNEVIAHLMDAGKYLYAKVASTTLYSTWRCINMEVFMRD